MRRITRAKESFFSTEQVAKLAALSRSTLERWVRERRIRPGLIRIGEKTYRLWTEADVAVVLRVKRKTYRKGRGRKRGQSD